MSEVPPSGQVPNVRPRIVRGILLGLLIAGALLIARHLLDRREPRAPSEAEAPAAALPTAPPLLVDLPPSASAMKRRADATAPAAATAPGPAAILAPAPPAASPAVPRPAHPREARATLDEDRPRAAVDAPPAVVVDARPAPAPSSPDVVAIPVPVLVVADLSGEVAQLEELERQRHLAWRERVVRPIDAAPMVRVEGTRFTMGHANGMANESPEHRVEVATFWIDQFEVSVEQALLFNEAAEEAGHGAIRVLGDQPDLPLGDVSWAEAEIYCEWVGGKLPTEAQWELAARAVDGRHWPWGAEFRAECVNADLEMGALREPMSVDSLECGAGLGGIRHLLGNVAEWTLDAYGLYTSDPFGEGGSWGVRRVVRGGSFLTRDPQALTTHSREGERPGSRRRDLGFRCVLSHEP